MQMARMLAVMVLISLLPIRADAEVVFDWATVGNPGNPHDGSGYGGVDYTYRIAKHEVTNGQYAEFLNAVDSTGANTFAFTIQIWQEAEAAF